MHWISKKRGGIDSSFNPDDVGDMVFSNDDLENELLELLQGDRTCEFSSVSPSSEQNKTKCDKDDELLLAELVKSMENENRPVSSGSNRTDDLTINEEDIFGNNKTSSTGRTSNLPPETAGFNNSGRMLNSKNETKYDKDDELLLAELVKSMENENRPVSSGSNRTDDLTINEEDIFGNNKTSSTGRTSNLPPETAGFNNSGRMLNSKQSTPSNVNSLESTLKVPSDSNPDVRQAVLDYINPRSLNSGLDLLKNRHKEYKLAALTARDAGQLNKAKELLEASKCIGQAIINIEAGTETFNLETDLPPHPSEYEFSDENDLSETTTIPPPPPPSSQPVKSNVPDIMKTPIICTENILARIAYYKEKSKRINDDATKRRFNRILTRYDEGLRACERGVTSFEFEELVPPPGYPQLTDRSKLGKSIKLTNDDQKSLPAKPATSDHCPTKSKTEETVKLLIKRQDELKQAAKVAKQAGNIELAKTYIRSCLGMNQMIQAAEAGLPVDLTQLPRPPTFTDSAASKPILSGLKCDPPVKYAIAFNSLSGVDLFKTYSEILSDQEKLVNHLINELRFNGQNNQLIMSKLSDLISVNTCVKKLLSKYNQHVTHLIAHFELANLPKSNVNAKLADDILEISEIRGIAYPIPSNYSNIDTYVEIELSLNASSPPLKLSTNVVKSNSEPIYSQSVKELRVNTKSRVYRRFVQNNRCLKATVYYNRGLFRSWGVLGVTEIPLTGLVQSATVTHIGDLKEGRKVVGGRLQVQLRQRESLCGEPIVYQQQPWLLLSPPKQTDSPRSVRIENTETDPLVSCNLSTPKQTDSLRSIRIESAKNNSPTSSNMSTSKQIDPPRSIKIENTMNNPIPCSTSSTRTPTATSSPSRVVIIRNSDNS
ncbi:Coiled-coil and C2 domain-containing protein isoform 1 [Schistosoma japonicum]|uniref:Coiled-coil and C2 domain-containing protein isoform 1 n=1 Tax=Schistosoma japonicum TaxID=6182 RepID=A0A4Z2DV60_SCHJA|nr:Coiled-coil and C2 domain-containing protein isoform 1 [Schistosoma japonicum]